ncbi:hypothetical protein WAX74_11970 [Psychrobacillus sp. FJAT-51614]|uniref:Lipoprotein n=1 Tax=Psychrobacillus mangrovi TaxID=3117745 RepID=A0ABU8F7Y5_9BACI
MRLNVFYVAVMISSLFFVATGCGIFAEPIKSLKVLSYLLRKQTN